MSGTPWPETTVQAICETPQYGFTASASADAAGPKYLRIMDIVPPSIDWASVPRCEIPKSHVDKYRIEPGDIVIARTGQGSVGSGRFIRSAPHEAVFASYLVRFRVKPPNVPRFVGYLVESKEYEAFVRSTAGGTSRPSASAPVLGAFPIPLPPPPIQKKIASVLSAYDDLIANNIRRIAILEDVARLIYREWFVEFRYPGHEGVPLVESELGPIPEGWDASPLGEVCARVQAGGTPRRSDDQFWNGGSINWYKTKELRDSYLFGSEEAITSAAVARSSAKLFDPGTILMAIYGSPTVGRLGVLTETSSCNQAALGLVADERVLLQNVLFYSLFELRSHFNTIAQGAAQQNISKATVSATKVPLPPLPLQVSFDSVAGPIRDQIRILESSIRVLRSARDLLLPRLVSGDIDVSDLDIDVGAVA